ncbi:MAG: pitrilysin family protein [Candidatus Bipolaricaulota bacterium]|nr:pitrilysin family protein [Candidatus Bipolaricaulota bacterium]
MIKSIYPGAFSARLANGVRILAEEVPTSRAVSLGIWIKAGSRDDPPSLPGLAHFLEHLIFKGTPTRDAARISREIDSIGGRINGATGKEFTFYYVDVPAAGLPTALEVLTDLVGHPALLPQEIDKERGVVLEEIRGHHDDPEQVAYDLFIAGLWRDKNPISRTVLGEGKTIASLKRQQLVKFHRRLYQPENMFLVACGAVDHESLFSKAERLFDGKSSTPVPKRKTPHIKGGRMWHHRPTGQTHVYMGLPAPAVAEGDRFPLEVVNMILGGGSGSRLFRSIREERGLAYAISSSTNYYSDTGAWLVYAGAAPESVETILDLMQEELSRLKEDGVTQGELSLAKAKLKGNLILAMEANNYLMTRLGTAAVKNGELLSPDEVLARLKAVSKRDIARAIDRFLQLDSMNLTVVGPTKPSVVPTSNFD